MSLKKIVTLTIETRGLTIETRGLTIETRGFTIETRGLKILQMSLISHNLSENE